MQVYQDIEGGGLRANAINRTNQTVEQQIWSFFRSKGYSSEGIAGIMGNFQAESALISNNVQNGVICIAFFVIGLIREIVFKKNIKILKDSLMEIDYYTISLLIGLFVVIGGIKNAGVIDVIGNAIAKVGAGSQFLIFTVIVWISVLLSAFIDNIPYTATMLTIVPVIAANVGMEPKLLYYGLLCGATLG